MRSRGFSLPELLCVLAAGAVLVGLATPSWRRPLGDSALRAATSQTLAGLALARRTALSTGRATTVCLTADMLRCDLSGREWMLFVNDGSDNLARRAPEEPLLRRWPLPREIRVTGTRDHAWYLPQTRAAATVTFRFCHPGAPGTGRSVIVSQTGRPRLEQAVPCPRTEP